MGDQLSVLACRHSGARRRCGARWEERHLGPSEVCIGIHHCGFRFFAGLLPIAGRTDDLTDHQQYPAIHSNRSLGAIRFSERLRAEVSAADSLTAVSSPLSGESPSCFRIAQKLGLLIYGTECDRTVLSMVRNSPNLFAPISSLRMTAVSIAIPCHNAGACLVEAVQSALDQTHPDVELIVVDDGSTSADTMQLLNQQHWPRTRVFRQEHAGPSAARNRAIREATGEYILPLDADDLIESTYVAKAAAVLDARPDVGIVYCHAAKFGAEEGPWDLPAFSPGELALGNVIFVSAMFRKGDWELVDGFDETLRYGMEDYDFWIRLVCAGRKVVRLDETLFHCRIRERSRTALFEEDREQVVATYAQIFRKNRDFFAEHADSLFRRQFALVKEVIALHARLADESKSAATERANFVGAKAEADRYNAALHSELERVQARYAALQRRFRWLKPLWPRRIPK